MFAQVEIHTPFLLKELIKLLLHVLVIIEFALNKYERYQELRNVTLYVN